MRPPTGRPGHPDRHRAAQPQARHPRLPFARRVLRLALPVLAVAVLAGCTAVGTLNALTARASYTASTGIAYGAEPRQRLDVFTPTTGLRPAAGWPVVVFFYGGSWASGERADYRFVGEALAARGVLAVIADYRLYPAVRYPDFLADCALAVAWTFAQAPALGGDPKRLFVMGHSAGAYNAAMLALDPRWLAAAGHSPTELAGWIGLAGPYDFFPTDDIAAQPVFFHPNYPAHAQPIEFALRGAPPSFLATATHDRVVNPQRSTVQLAAKLQAAGVPVTLKLYGGATSHATLIGAFAWPLRWIAPVREDVLTFIQEAPPRP